MFAHTLLIALFFLECATSAYGMQKGSFSVRQRTSASRLEGGPEALRRAYLKHGMPLPEMLQKRQVFGSTGTGFAPKATTTASVTAESEKNDLEYLSTVNIGGTMMRLDFDTGSSDLWVFSDRLPMQQRNGHTWYALDTTKSGQPVPGSTWKIAYGDGSGASGIVYADKVIIGSATATSQAVEAATSVSTQFIVEASDGLLGLGFGHTNTIKPTRQATFFENIKSTLRAPLFTVSLKKNATGVYDFGYIDQTKYIEPLQYIPVNTTRGYWEYTATGYAIGNKIPMTPLTFQAIADTGTTLMLLPPAAAADYWSQVRGARNNQSEGGYVFPCDATLPDLHIQMTDNVVTTVPGHFMNRSLSQTPNSRFCYGGIQPGSPTLSIWGDVFLKSQFAVFDGGAVPRIGFARQVENWSGQVGSVGVGVGVGAAAAAAQRPGGVYVAGGGAGVIGGGVTSGASRIGPLWDARLLSSFAKRVAGLLNFCMAEFTC